MLIDVGANLTSKRFEKDTDLVISRALQSGIEKIIITGTSIPESEAALSLSRQYPGVLYSTAGIHPHHAKDFSEESLIKLSLMLEQENVLAIGECGLDFNRNFSQPDEQRVCFEAQCQLAVEKNAAVFLHQRDAHQDLVRILSKYIDKLPAAVVHCFTGTEAELNCYLEMGLYIGITGWICDERRGQSLKAIVNQIPLDKIMIETDAPYLLPRDIKPKPKSNRNEPAFLSHICQAVADCYGQSYSLIEKQSYKNTIDFFQIKAR